MEDLRNSSEINRRNLDLSFSNCNSELFSPSANIARNGNQANLVKSLDFELSDDLMTNFQENPKDNVQTIGTKAYRHLKSEDPNKVEFNYNPYRYDLKTGLSKGAFRNSQIVTNILKRSKPFVVILSESSIKETQTAMTECTNISKANTPASRQTKVRLPVTKSEISSCMNKKQTFLSSICSPSNLNTKARSSQMNQVIQKLKSSKSTYEINKNALTNQPKQPVSKSAKVKKSFRSDTRRLSDNSPKLGRHRTPTKSKINILDIKSKLPLEDNPIAKCMVY